MGLACLLEVLVKEMRPVVGLLLRLNVAFLAKRLENAMPTLPHKLGSLSTSSHADVVIMSLYIC